MFCKNCGKQISDRASECPKCNTSTRDKMHPNFCPVCGREVLDMDNTCYNCGEPLGGPGLDRVGWTTKEIKRTAHEAVDRKEVRRKSSYVFSYAIPVILLIILGSYVVAHAHVLSVVPGYVIGAVIGIPMGILTVAFYKNCHKAIYGKAVGMNTSFEKTVWIGAVIAYIVSNGFNVAAKAVANSNKVAATLGHPQHGGVQFLLELIPIVLIPIVYFITYIAATHTKEKTSVRWVLEQGIRLGLKYYFRIWLLILSFIPLGLLIGVTFGILAIWKGMYIETSFCVLFEKILIKEGLVKIR